MSITSINDPFYCVWCGKVFPKKEDFIKHYAEEIKDDNELTSEQLADFIHNENNY